MTTRFFIYVIIFTVLAVLATVVRVWCRRSKKSVGFDDGLVIVAKVTHNFHAQSVATVAD